MIDLVGFNKIFYGKVRFFKNHNGFKNFSFGIFSLIFNQIKWIYRISVFRPLLSVFVHFFFSTKTVFFFRLHFYMSIPALTRPTHWVKVFPKKIFCAVVQPYFKISLLSFIHKIFEQNLYQNVTVYLVRIWTYKNTDEKAHTYSRRSKNVKKTNEKRILCKSTFNFAKTNYLLL